MLHRLATLFLLLSLFALSATRAWACGSNGAVKYGQKSTEKSCCSKGKAQTPCADDSGYQHSGSDCPCHHDSGGCHCPGCGIFCHSSAAAFAPAEVATSPPLLFAASVQRQEFYFAEHLPEAVYLPIWQPPQLSV